MTRKISEIPKEETVAWSWTDLLEGEETGGDSFKSTAAVLRDTLKSYLDAYYAPYSATRPAFKNLLVNGAMAVSQRGTSETGVTSSKYAKAPDRFWVLLSGLGTWTPAQDTDAPDGFGNSYKLTCTVADASPAAADALILLQKVEGRNLQQLKKGAASAETTSLSFRVKSNLTGTYIVEIVDIDNSRSISKSFTIDSADTWETKEISISGDTSGVLDNDNAESLQVRFWLGAGSNYTSGTLATSWQASVDTDRAVGQVNLAGSVSNYINITGVQFEIGSATTDFEHLPFGVDLEMCGLYYQKSFDIDTAPAQAAGYAGTETMVCTGASAAIRQTIHFSPPMRDAPTVTIYNPTNANGEAYDATAAADCSGTGSAAARLSNNSATVISTSPGTGALGDLVEFHWTADAEL